MLLAIAAPANDRWSMPEPCDSLSSFLNESPTMLPELVRVHQNAATIYSKAWQAYRLHKHQSNLLSAISALAGERQSSQSLMLCPEGCQNWIWYTRILAESTPEPDKPTDSTKIKQQCFKQLLHWLMIDRACHSHVTASHSLMNCPECSQSPLQSHSSLQTPQGSIHIPFSNCCGRILQNHCRFYHAALDGCSILQNHCRFNSATLDYCRILQNYLWF